MMTLLAHVTPNEFPWGAVLFIAGWAAGLGTAGVFLRYFRTR